MTTIDGPLGATLTREGVHFRVFSSLADRIELCLFDEAGEESRYDLVREPGFIWHLFLPGITAGQAYGYRVHGPYDPACGLRCNPAKLLTDPVRQGPLARHQVGPRDVLAIRSAATSSRSSRPTAPPTRRAPTSSIRRSTGAAIAGRATGPRRR